LRGRVPAATYAQNLANTLRQSVGVAPTPYFNGAFEGRQCQRIGQRLSRVCELLAAFVPAALSKNYNESCATWQRILPILTRAGDVSSDEASAFRRDAASFVDNLRGAFEWTSVTVKLHTLCCHAPDVLEQFGSLGRYSEQGLKRGTGITTKMPGCTRLTRSLRAALHTCGIRPWHVHRGMTLTTVAKGAPRHSEQAHTTPRDLTTSARDTERRRRVARRLRLKLAGRSRWLTVPSGLVTT